MRKRMPLVLNFGILVVALVSMAISPMKCGEPPVCTDIDMSMIGEFDGVVYDEYGQHYSNWTEFCANIHDEVTSYSNSDDIQTIVMREDYNGEYLYVIYMGNFKYPQYWNGGAQFLVFYDAAEESYETGTAIPLDGKDAVGYYWDDGYWDGDNPGFITNGGEIAFSIVSLVSGGPVRASFDSSLGPYVAPPGTASGSTTSIRDIPPFPFPGM